MANLGKLNVVLELDMGKFQAGLNAAQGRLSAFEKRTENLSRSFAQMGQKLIMAGAGVSAGTGLIIKAAADLEDAMIGVRKTTGMAGEELESLRTHIRKLSKDLPVSSTELAKIATVAGQLGIRGVENITRFTETAAKMATATEMTAEEAALQLAKISNGFQEPIEQANLLGSVINELSNTTAANSREIAESIRRMAPGANQLRVTSTEAAALAAALISTGMSSERVGSRMNRAFTRMATDYKTMAEEIGMDTEQFKRMIEEDAVGALEYYLREINKIPSNIDRIDAITATFGQVGAKAINSLASGMEDYNRISEQAHEERRKGTSLEKEYAAAMEGTWNQLNVLKNEFIDMAVALGDELIPVIKDEVIPILRDDFLPVIRDVVVWFREAPHWVKQFALALGPLTIVLGILSMVFSAFFKILGMVIKLGKIFMAVFTPIGAALLGIAAIVGIVVTKFDELMDGLWRTGKTIASWMRKMMEWQRQFLQWTLDMTPGFMKGTRENLEKEIGAVDKWLQKIDSFSDRMTENMKGDAAETNETLSSMRAKIEEFKNMMGSLSEESSKATSDMKNDFGEVNEAIGTLKETMRKMQGGMDSDPYGQNRQQGQGYLTSAGGQPQFMLASANGGRYQMPNGYIPGHTPRTDQPTNQQEQVESDLSHLDSKLNEIELSFNSIRSLSDTTTKEMVSSYGQGGQVSQALTDTNRNLQETGGWIDGLSQKFINMGTTATQIVATSFRSTLSGVMKGEIEDFGDFIDQTADRIKDAWIDMIANMVTNWIFGVGAMQGQGFGGGSGLGGASLFGMIGKMFAGGAGGATSGSSGGFLSAADVGGGFQHGTDFVPSTGLYKLHKGEKVVPRQEAGGRQITIVNSISPDFIGEAIRQNEDMIINPITAHLMRRGQLRQVIKET